MPSPMAARPTTSQRRRERIPHCSPPGSASSGRWSARRRRLPSPDSRVRVLLLRVPPPPWGAVLADAWSQLVARLPARTAWDAAATPWPWRWRAAWLRPAIPGARPADHRPRCRREPQRGGQDRARRPAERPHSCGHLRRRAVAACPDPRSCGARPRRRGAGRRHPARPGARLGRPRQAAPRVRASHAVAARRPARIRRHRPRRGPARQRCADRAVA